MRQTQSNLAWYTLLDLGSQRPGPLHARIADALRVAIRSGRLAAGQVLPPSRLLATELGCSRWTVTEVYQQLAAEGYLQARVGSGTTVVWREQPVARSRPSRPRPAPAPGIDLAPGLPDLRAFPLTRWLAAMRAAAATLPHQQLGYPAPGGELRLREVLAERLRRVRGAATDPDHVSICGGVSDAVTRLCRALHSAGMTTIAMEDPGWTRLRELISATGMRVVPIPVDEQGLRVELLDRHPEVRAAVVSPAHQFPAGVVLAPERRSLLLDWARRVDGLIVEDDYDAEFRYDRRPVGTMQGTDPDRVALTGSLSKTLSPAIGIGWIVTPPRWTAAIRDTTAPGPGVLDQAALATFIESGSYDRHLRSVARRYRSRRDTLVQALAHHLPDCTVAGAAAGLHLLLHYPRAGDGAGGLPGPQVVRRAASLGVRIACARQYRVDNTALDSALVLGYGNLSDADVEPAVVRLASALRVAAPSGHDRRRGDAAHEHRGGGTSSHRR